MFSTASETLAVLAILTMAVTRARMRQLPISGRSHREQRRLLFRHSDWISPTM